MEAMTTADRPRGRAREARSNDRHVLDAAQRVFGEHGWDAPMSAIAEAAGVGVASIYRRYPSKNDLVLALRLGALRDVTDIAIASRAAAPPPTPPPAPTAPSTPLPPEPAAVARFLRAHIREASAPLVSTYGRNPIPSAEVDELAEELYAALLGIIADDAASLPAGYTPADLMLGITHLRPTLPAAPERLAEIHLRHVDYYLLGLRADAADPGALSGTGSTWQEWLGLHNSARPAWARD